MKNWQKYLLILIFITNTFLFIKRYYDKNRSLQRIEKKSSLIQNSIDSLISIYSKPKDKFTRIDSLLINHGFSSKWIINKNNEKIVRVPANKTLLEYNLFFLNYLSQIGINVIKSETDIHNRKLFIYFSDKKQVKQLSIIRHNYFKKQLNLKPKFIIVIHNLGKEWQSNTYYELQKYKPLFTVSILPGVFLGWDLEELAFIKDPHHVQGFIKFPKPLTLAITPGYWATNKIAQRAHQQKKEILVELPFSDDQNNSQKKEIIIYSKDNGFQIKEKLQKSFKLVPYAKGIHNSYFAKPLSNYKFMDLFFSVYKKFKFPFILYKTNIISAAKPAAFKHDVLFKESFYDSSEQQSKSSIKLKFEKALSLHQKGYDVILMIPSNQQNYQSVLEMVKKYPYLNYSTMSKLFPSYYE